jgi:hypothetical protein
LCGAHPASDEETDDEGNASDSQFNAGECHDAYLSIGKPIKEILELAGVEEDDEESDEEELKDFDSEVSDEEEWERAEDAELSDLYDEDEAEEAKLRTLRTQSERNNRTLNDFDGAAEDGDGQQTSGRTRSFGSNIASSGGHDLRIKRNSYHYPPPPSTDGSAQEAEQPTEPKFRGLHLYQSRRAQLVIEDEGPKSDMGGAERGLVLTREVDTVASLDPYSTAGDGSGDSAGGSDRRENGSSGETATRSVPLGRLKGSGERRLRSNPAAIGGVGGQSASQMEIGGEMTDLGIRRHVRKLYDNRVVRKSKMHLFPMGKRRDTPIEVLPSKNWNEEFQKLWERKLGASRDTPESREGFENEQLVVRLGIGKLASEFTELALKLGKVLSAPRLALFALLVSLSDVKPHVSQYASLFYLRGAHR